MPQGTPRRAVRIRRGSKVLDSTGEQGRRTEEPRDWAAPELTEHNVKVPCIEAARWHVAGFVYGANATVHLSI